MTLTDEQRAHEVALKFAELKCKQADELARLNGKKETISFSQIYLDAYQDLLKRLRG